MKSEYDFSKGQRGKFFRPDAEFEITPELRAVTFSPIGGWTNASVIKLAGGRDPISTIVGLARSAVAEAIDRGWKGPPYDPIELADLMGLRIQPSSDIREARTVPLDQDELRIEFNPNQPRHRVRYSIAHEIAHTFFPDCQAETRHRHSKSETTSDAWQLEALCNVAAAELLMPYGSMPAIERAGMSIEHLLALRQQFHVSTEAMLIRAVHLADFTCAMFGAHRIEAGDRTGYYQLDYAIQSADRALPVSKQKLFEPNSTVAQCTAIGYTAKGIIKLGEVEAHVECVGIPPYPGASFPRVVGVLLPSDASSTREQISYLKGSVLAPRGEGRKLIAHVVNNKTVNWGGSGIARAIRNKWPSAQEEFRQWGLNRKLSSSLGEVHVHAVAEDISVASMVAQVGYGPSPKPRIRYSALKSCLDQVCAHAAEKSASIHMPRVGCGQAGGRWEIVEDLVRDSASKFQIHVTVYDLPDL